MKLTPEQLQKLRKSFDRVGAFEGRTEEEVEKTLSCVMEYYLAFANINIRIKKEKVKKDDNETNL